MNILINSFDKIYNFLRANSLRPYIFATSCCSEEINNITVSDNDSDIFIQNVQISPNQADVLIIAGTINQKSLPDLLDMYEQMPEPKYVIAVGSCACTGGVYKDNYNIVNGADKIIPVDIYIPACPPTEDAIIGAINKLKEKIKSETILKRKEYISSHTIN